MHWPKLVYAGYIESGVKELYMVLSQRSRKEDASAWTVADSRSIYGIRHWGSGYFNVNEQGNIEVRPRPDVASTIDLHQLVGQLRDSGLDLPLLLRFPDSLTRSCLLAPYPLCVQ